MKKVKYLSLAIIIVFILTGCGKINQNVAEQYCDILVKGNYGDILDIAYFPQSDFITKDKIKEAKQKYFEEVSENNNGVSSCEATQINEDDKKIYYKLIKNETDTENIEVDKKTNKIMIEGLYVNSEIIVGEGTTVYIDGVELKNSEKQQNEDLNVEYVYVYKITSLKYADYKIKYTHVFYKDQEGDLCKEENCTNSKYINGAVLYDEDIKDQDVVNNLKDMFKEIALVGFERKDKSSLSKYFYSSDAMEFVDIFKYERKTQSNETYTYKKLNDDNTVRITGVWYNAEDEIKLQVQVDFIADISHWFKGTEEGKACVIAEVVLRKNGSWQIASFENVVYG